MDKPTTDEQVTAEAPEAPEGSEQPAHEQPRFRLPAPASDIIKPPPPDYKPASPRPSYLPLKSHAEWLYKSLYLTAGLLVIPMLLLTVLGLPLSGHAVKPLAGLLWLGETLGKFMTVISALFFWRWVNTASANIVAAGYQKQSPAWMVLWGLCPIANLFMPYILMKALWRESVPAETSNPWLSKDKTPNSIKTWWTCWLASTLAAPFVAVIMGCAAAFLTHAFPSDLMGKTMILTSNSFRAGSLIVLVGIVREITHMQHHKFLAQNK